MLAATLSALHLGGGNTAALHLLTRARRGVCVCEKECTVCTVSLREECMLGIFSPLASSCVAASVLALSSVTEEEGSCFWFL